MRQHDSVNVDVQQASAQGHSGDSAYLQLEFVGQLEVQLHCGALELPLQGIEDGDVNLGPIEGSIRRIELHMHILSDPTSCQRPTHI